MEMKEERRREEKKVHYLIVSPALFIAKERARAEHRGSKKRKKNRKEGKRVDQVKFESMRRGKKKIQLSHERLQELIRLNPLIHMKRNDLNSRLLNSFLPLHPHHLQG